MGVKESFVDSAEIERTPCTWHGRPKKSEIFQNYLEQRINCLIEPAVAQI